MGGQLQPPTNGVAPSRFRHGLDERALPHNLAAEASILGGVILQNSVLARLPDLETDDFYDMRHKVVWQAIRNLEAANRPIDLVTLEVEIERQEKLDAVGGVAYLGELAIMVPTPDNVVDYAQRVRVDAKNRRAILKIAETLQRAKDWRHDASELVVELAGELQRLEVDATRAPKGRVELLSVEDAFDDLENFKNARVYPTPFETLNDAIGFGGFIGSQVYTVAAGTGRGKTSWAAAIATHTAEHTGPVVVSVHELGPGYFVARKAAGILDVSSNRVLRGEVSRELISRALPFPRLRFLPRKSGKMADRRPTLELLRRAVEQLADEYGAPPLVVVDYLQKLADEIARTQLRPDLRMATTEASSTLVEIAEQTGAAIVCVSSIGRGKKILSNPRKLQPYELVEVAKESGAVEYDGAGMIVISLSNDLDGDERIGTITLAKARFGAEVHIDSRYHGARGTWRDMGRVQVVEKVATPPAPKDAAKDAEREVPDDVLRDRLIKSLQQEPARGKDHLVTRVQGNKTRLRHLYDELFTSGVIGKIGTGITLTEIGRQRLLGGM